MNVATQPQTHEDATWERVIKITMIFVLIGPFFGGLTLFIAMSAAAIYRHGAPQGLLEGLWLFILMSYWIGAALALLTALIVAWFRVALGRTTIVTPIIAALLAWGVSILLNIMFADGKLKYFLPGAPEVSIIFLPPALIASVACWFIAKKAKLA